MSTTKPDPDPKQHSNRATASRATGTARIAATLIDRAHREAGERRARGDRAATATIVLSEWAERGASMTSNEADR